MFSNEGIVIGIVTFFSERKKRDKFKVKLFPSLQREWLQEGKGESVLFFCLPGIRQPGKEFP